MNKTNILYINIFTIYLLVFLHKILDNLRLKIYLCNKQYPWVSIVVICFQNRII